MMMQCFTQDFTGLQLYALSSGLMRGISQQLAYGCSADLNIVTVPAEATNIPT